MLTHHRLLRSGLRGIAALAVCALALPLRAALPGQVDFQGLLLDAGGQKVNGAVDLVFTLYDAATAGNALWTESHADVQVADGVYGVTLGATTPLTQAELGGGNVWLEIAVEGETLSPRRQLLAVPYAIRAQSAESTDAVAGISGAFYTEMIQHFAFDGADPPNDHPSEGTADVDGDGQANFVDADNDGDGLSDAAELGQGSDINLVTPVISGFAPTTALAALPQSITVQGSNFEPGMGVAFGLDNPVPTNVTSTSFVVNVGAQPKGNASVVVTRANGQSDSASYSFRGRKVFLSDSYGPAFPGVAGADALCATKAAALGLPGTFRAWIGDSTTSPAARFLQDAVPYERHSDGVLIASSWADLVDGSLTSPMTTGFTLVFTGTLSDGTAAAAHCGNWTIANGTQNGMLGATNETDFRWTQAGAVACTGTPHPVYCFEQ